MKEKLDIGIVKEQMEDMAGLSRKELYDLVEYWHTRWEMVQKAWGKEQSQNVLQSYLIRDFENQIKALNNAIAIRDQKERALTLTTQYQEKELREINEEIHKIIDEQTRVLISALEVLARRSKCEK